MHTRNKVVVVGLGEVGRPLLELMSEYHEATGIDVNSVERVEKCDVLHICFPFEIKDFVGECARYIETYKPQVTIINSTIALGTTRQVAERTGTAVVNSPIRGKHARMLEELRVYTKYIGALDASAGELAAAHFQSVGMKTRILASPEATELAKLTETTYFGVLIAWAQEVERYCEQSGASYDEVVSFYDEIGYLPRVKFWPGVIGGHCVMPNIEILRVFRESRLLDVICESNQIKVERAAANVVEVGSRS